jgi:ubiquinone/menaquinone biosynthesis C-methylase UbiE
MVKSVVSELGLDQLRKKFLKYTRKAFQMLPKMKNPQILDIGCGSGVPTLELAKLSNGQIVGIDTDQTLLDDLNRAIDEEGLAHRVKTRNCSLFNIEFPNESFDFLWAEGVLDIIGFEKGLQEWMRLLKPNGFLVVHDAAMDLAQKFETIKRCGYKLTNFFQLPQDAWLVNYYQPLELRIKELQVKYEHDPEALKTLQQHQNDVDMVKGNPKASESVFLILQKEL